MVQPDQTYYIIDMICWRGYSLYDCTAEFRFFWVNSKLTETSAGDPPSTYHRYRFSAVPIYECTLEGLQAAYSGNTPYVKDGLLFYNKYNPCSLSIISSYFSKYISQPFSKSDCSVIRHAHYQAGITPLTLVWKDETCSQYVIDTDSRGEIPNEQQVCFCILMFDQYYFHHDIVRCTYYEDFPSIFSSYGIKDTFLSLSFWKIQQKWYAYSVTSTVSHLIIFVFLVSSYTISLCWNCKRMES